MSTEAMTLTRLQNLESTRSSVAAVDAALSLLTPEERLVAHLLLLHPQRGNVQKVCEKLNIEQATAYRRRKQVLQKLTATLYPEGNAKCKMQNAK